MHGNLALQFDAVEVLHSFGGCLPQEGQGQEQLPCSPGLLVALTQLVVLQGFVEKVLELLHRIHVLYVHRVWGEGRRESKQDMRKETVSSISSKDPFFLKNKK